MNGFDDVVIALELVLIINRVLILLMVLLILWDKVLMVLFDYIVGGMFGQRFLFEICVMCVGDNCSS